jgi:L-fucose isomerase-like protein
MTPERPFARTRPTIGFLPIGRLAGPDIQRNYELGRALIGQIEADVEECPMVWAEPDVLDQVERLRSREIDLLVIYVLHGMSAEQQVLAGVTCGAPVALWALNSDYSFSSCTSAIGALRERHIPAKMALATAGDESVLPDIAMWARAAFARAQLRRSRIGVLGGIFPNLPAAQYHRDILFEKLGPQVVHLTLAGLQATLDAVADESVDLAVERLRERFVVKVSDDLVRQAARFDLALGDLAASQRLAGFAIECHTETNLLFGINPCLSFAHREPRIAIGCEGDVEMAAHILMARWLTGADAYLGDIFSLTDGVLTLKHCGASCQMARGEDVAIAGLKAPATVGVDRTLAMCMPRLPDGRVTLMRLHGRETYRLHVAMGDVIGSEADGGTTVSVRLDEPGAFLREVCGNHYLLAYGDLRPALAVLAGWMELEITET